MINKNTHFLFKFLNGVTNYKYLDKYGILLCLSVFLMGIRVEVSLKLSFMFIYFIITVTFQIPQNDLATSLAELCKVLSMMDF